MKKLNWLFRRFLIRQMSKRTRHGLESSINSNCISQIAIKKSNELLLRGWDGENDSIPHFAGCRALTINPCKNANTECDCGTKALAEGNLLKFLITRMRWQPRIIQVEMATQKECLNHLCIQTSGVRKGALLISGVLRRIGPRNSGRHVFYRSLEESSRQFRTAPCREDGLTVGISGQSNS